MLCNPKSGTKYASTFLTDYPKVNNRRLMVPLQDLTEQKVPKEEKVLLDCTLYLFNVIEAKDRTECREMLTRDLKEDPGSDKVVGIMGGDGSMGTTLKFLREVEEIEQGLAKREVGIVILPFGTGNDTAQVFGWGNHPQDEFWYDDIGCLITDIVTGINDSLSLWQVRVDTRETLEAASKTKENKQVFRASDNVDTGITNAYDEPVFANQFVMCCYFNIGLEAQVGISK